MSKQRSLFVGVMSGTSLDGADAIVADFSAAHPRVLGFASAAYSDALRQDLLRLNAPGENEIDRAAHAGLQLAQVYSEVTHEAMRDALVSACDVEAIGCHGQTIRHRPDLGYTIQLNNPALLAELTGCNIVSDFRSRDVAAGGQGAPLVPAFHDGAFRSESETRVVANIGGIANLTILAPGEPAWGFDCGPGNCLMDHWAAQHGHGAFDANGAWARAGQTNIGLLKRLQAEPYFAAPPPKSTGRDLFNPLWLAAKVSSDAKPESVQATLLELTTWGIISHVHRYVPSATRLLICGGGAKNGALMDELARQFAAGSVDATDDHGVPAQHVEALAFAWLACQYIGGARIDLTRTTGARHITPLGTLTRA